MNIIASNEPTLYRRVITRANKNYYSNEIIYPKPFLESKSYVSEKSYHDVDKYTSSTEYLDGAGRVVQKTQRINDVDIVLPITYDYITGKQTKSYLPYSTYAADEFRSDGTQMQQYYYERRFGPNNYAFSETKFDNTPQSNITEQSAPGELLSMALGHTVKYNTSKSASQSTVKKYVMQDTIFRLDRMYGASELIIKKVTDQDNIASYEYYDHLGQLVAKASNDKYTYYVYDDLGQLRYIIPPAQDSRPLTEWAKWCYRTDYDALGRPYKQYVPGAGYTIALYDKRHRKVLVQDALLRQKGQWTFTKYDIYDRPIISGICTGTEAAHSSALAAQKMFGEARGTALHGYTNVTYPTSVTTANCLNITYYDDYDWTTQVHSFSTADAVGSTPSSAINGMSTGMKTKVIGVSADQWLTSAVYYNS